MSTYNPASERTDEDAVDFLELLGEMFCIPCERVLMSFVGVKGPLSELLCSKIVAKRVRLTGRSGDVHESDNPMEKLSRSANSKVYVGSHHHDISMAKASAKRIGQFLFHFTLRAHCALQRQAMNRP